MNWINDLGEVRESKNGGFYIVLNKDITVDGQTVEAGRNVHLKSLEDNLNGLVSRGYITEEEKATRLESQGFIKYFLSIPPKKD